MAEPLTYQEILRTLGTMLDICGSERAIIRLSHQRVEVAAPGGIWSRDWTMPGLVGVSAYQRAWRGQRSPYRLPTPGLRWHLRLVGAELDVQGAGSYVLTAEPESVNVQSQQGYERVFTAPSLKRRGKLAPYMRRHTLAGAPSSSPSNGGSGASAS